MKNEKKRDTIVAIGLLLLLLVVMTIIDSLLPSYHIVIKVIKKAAVYSLVAACFPWGRQALCFWAPMPMPF